MNEVLFKRKSEYQKIIFQEINKLKFRKRLKFDGAMPVIIPTLARILLLVNLKL